MFPTLPMNIYIRIKYSQLTRVIQLNKVRRISQHIYTYKGAETKFNKKIILLLRREFCYCVHFFSATLKKSRKLYVKLIKIIKITFDSLSFSQLKYNIKHFFMF